MEVEDRNFQRLHQEIDESMTPLVPGNLVKDSLHCSICDKMIKDHKSYDAVKCIKKLAMFQAIERGETFISVK